MKQFTRAVVSAALCAALSLACTLPAYAAEGEMLEVNEDISVSADYDWTRFANDHLTLNVYNWGLYISDGSDDSVNVVSAFEDLTGIKVNYTTFDSNESLYAKMKSGGASYDVIVPSDYMVGKMIAENMLAELDYDNIPNMANIGENYLGWSYDPDNTYSVPYTWGTTGIIYNTTMVEEPPTSWADLWKPEYKGRVILLNDSRETIGMALKKNGHSVNTKNEQELAGAVKDLKRLTPNLLAYDTDTIKQKFIAEEAWIGTMWSGDASFTHKDNKNIAFVIPKEGAVIWADTFAIPKGAKNKELAQEFINYLYDPKVSAKNYEYIGYNDPNANAQSYHSEEYNNDPMLKTAKDFIGKGEWIKDIGKSLSLYDRYWTELKTGK